MVVTRCNATACEILPVIKERTVSKRLYPAVLLLPLLGSFIASCSGGGGPTGGGGPLPKPPAEQYVIDGVVDLSVFSAVTQTVIDMKSTFGTGTSVGTTTLRYAIVNDERHLGSHKKAQKAQERQNPFEIFQDLLCVLSVLCNKRFMT
jgi:hypothetical protein